jgi:CubicO group peptidase (beta-lactamase class C family)
MKIEGEAHRDFRALRGHFERRLEASEGGGALTVYHRGAKVVDLWGGVRAPDGSPWERETPSLSFSTTKGVTSTALHLCVDRGLLRYDDPVCRHWPEFAQAGKEGVTVRHVLTHEAGLYDVRGLVEHATDLTDWDRTIQALAAARPAHAPGRFNAYHALTYGYLVGEIVRRASGAHLRDFVRTELAEPLGLDHLHIGATPDAVRAAARYFPLPGADGAPLSERRASPRARAMGAGMRLLRLAGVPFDPKRSLGALAPHGMRDFDWCSDASLAACNPSASGLFTARSLARMYAALAGGGAIDGMRLVSEETVRRASQVQNRRPDGVLVVPMHWRLGYHSIVSKRGFHRGAFGHYGYRGSGAFADPRRALSVAYTTNAGGGSPIGDGRIFELAGVAARCVDARGV